MFTALCRARGPTPHLRVWGGLPSRHVRVHDFGRALPKHPPGVAAPLRPAPGRARPGPLPGGGGVRPCDSWVLTAALRPLSPAPTLCASLRVAPRTALSHARRLVPLLCGRRCWLRLPLHCPVAVPGRAPSCRAASAALGGWEPEASRLATGSRTCRGGPVPGVLHLSPRPSALLRHPCRSLPPTPPVARSSKAEAEAQSHASRVGSSPVIRCESLVFVVVSRGRRRPPAAGLTVHTGARSDWASRVLVGGPDGLPVTEERALRGEVRRHSEGRGHGPPELRRPAGPSGRVAPGLCTAPEIPARGGRGARPRVKRAGPTRCAGRGLEGEGGGGGD